MAYKWICKECGWEVSFPAKTKIFDTCPLCKFDVYDRNAPGKHEWISATKALKTLEKIGELSNAFIQEISVEKKTFSAGFKLKNCVINQFNGRGAIFKIGLEIENCVFLETLELGAGHSVKVGEFIEGATAQTKISIRDSRLFGGANLGEVSIDGQLICMNLKSFQEFDLSGTDISGTANLSNSFFNGLTLRNSKIGGLLILKKSIFEKHFYLNGSVVEGLLQAEDCEFKGEFYLGESSFSKEVNFSRSSFLKETVFDSLEFFDGFEFEKATVKDTFLLTGIEFNGWVSMDWCLWESGVIFQNVSFKGDVSIQDSQFNEDFNTKISTFDGDSNFARTNFKGNLHFEVTRFVGKAGFRDTKIQGKTILDRVKFADNIYFSRANFQQLLTMRKCQIQGEAFFTDANFLKGVDARRSEFSNGINFSNSVAHANISFSFCNIHGHFDVSQIEIIGTLNLADSLFTGTFSFVEAKTHSIDIRSSQVKKRLISENEKNWEEASNEWETLKNSFQKQSRAIDADFASFKLRQLDNRIPGKGLTRISKYFERVFIEWGTGYGTKPENVFFMSFVTILIFATVFSYYSSDVLEAGNRSFIDYLKFSFAIFSTLGTSNIIIALEAFVGGFLMAMFTALLTRRIFRN